MRLPASLLLLLVSALPAFGQPYSVAPTGSDRNPGTLERPFASLGRAQQAARQKPGSVLLRDGTYYLPETLVFNAQDSGTPAAPAVYQGYRDERPVLSGGVRLEKLDWQPYRDGILQATIRLHNNGAAPGSKRPVTAAKAPHAAATAKSAICRSRPRRLAGALRLPTRLAGKLRGMRPF